MNGLIIRFRNAGFFQDTRWSKDKVLDDYGVHERRHFRRTKVPAGRLPVSSISNLLHVLMGERPSPTIRKTSLKPVKEITELAEGALYQLDNPIDHRKEKDRYFDETMTVRKAVSNSWSTVTHTICLNDRQMNMRGCVLTWQRLNAYLGKSLYDDFQALVYRVLPGSKETCERTMELLNEMKQDTRVVNFIKTCINAKKPYVANILEGNGYTETDAAAAFHQQCSVFWRVTVSKGVEKISRLHGSILVPLKKIGRFDENAWLRKIRNGTGVATFLEGGFACIDSIAEMSTFLQAEYTTNAE